MTEKPKPNRLTIDAMNDRVFTKEDMVAALCSADAKIQKLALSICAPLFNLGEEVEGGNPHDLAGSYFAGTAEKMKTALRSAIDKKIFFKGIELSDADMSYIYTRYKTLDPAKQR
jgi:hypothetical protein